jgi:hypothetical protein
MIFGKRHDEEKYRRRVLMFPHSWFCWFPVRLEDGRYAWLCNVGRVLEENPHGDYFRYWDCKSL